MGDPGVKHELRIGRKLDGLIAQLDADVPMQTLEGRRPVDNVLSHLGSFTHRHKSEPEVAILNQGLGRSP